MQFKETIDFIKAIYNNQCHIPLHAPLFTSKEKYLLNQCIESTFVSSVGEFVDKFQDMVMHFTGAKYAIATVNGTAALHIALKLAGVDNDSEVITQPLTFVATCNAITYCGADPVFVDVEKSTLGMDPEALKKFLKQNATIKNRQIINKTTGKKISAVVPVHIYGHPCQIDAIASLCAYFNIPLIEDAAESLGSFYMQKHTGRFGKIGIFSFNGNKIITTGGGGMIITDDQSIAERAYHITTTAKVPHPHTLIHDETGYNYRMPNINAALGCAQMEKLNDIILLKRNLASQYKKHFSLQEDLDFVCEPPKTKSNYWLNTICLNKITERDLFITECKQAGIMTRSAWRLMNRLPMFRHTQCGSLSNAEWLEARLVNIPSGVSF